MASTLDLQNKTDTGAFQFLKFLVIGTLFRVLQKYKDRAPEKKNPPSIKILGNPYMKSLHNFLS